MGLYGEERVVDVVAIRHGGRFGLSMWRFTGCNAGGGDARGALWRANLCYVPQVRGSFLERRFRPVRVARSCGGARILQVTYSLAFGIMAPTLLGVT
jgi:hypothetical protein